MASPRLATVMLRVADVERAFAFYRGVFGFAEVPGVSSRPRFAALATGGGLMLALQGLPAGQATEGRAASPELAFEVADPEEMAQRIAELGGTVTGRGRMMWGRSVEAHDPDGHSLVLSSRAGSSP